jgi:hypothetical protein
LAGADVGGEEGREDVRVGSEGEGAGTPRGGEKERGPWRIPGVQPLHITHTQDNNR